MHLQYTAALKCLPTVAGLRQFAMKANRVLSAKINIFMKKNFPLRRIRKLRELAVIMVASQY